MVKYCIVHGCTSGLPSDRKNRQKNNMRQSSLFKVPKSNVLREKWAKALSQQLSPNQFVCEKHFREEDIKKAHRLIINGAETIIPRERWTLINDNVIPKNNVLIPISTSTRTGLKVSLNGALGLLNYLHVECNYIYLMTSRLSQDPIERFFSIMRNACGSNDHPDPKLFGQVFRLASCFSLVRPPKDCNVSGPELLSTLMQTKDSLRIAQMPRNEWLAKLDDLVDGNCEDGPNNNCHNPLLDHDYNVVRTSQEVEAYIAGYVVRKMQSSMKCQHCLSTLIANVTEHAHARNELINLRDIYSGLVYPSTKLFILLDIIEETVLDVVCNNEVQLDTLHAILDEVSKRTLPEVGCADHKHAVTVQVIDTYLIMRGFFLSKYINKKKVKSKLKQRLYGKMQNIIESCTCTYL